MRGNWQKVIKMDPEAFLDLANQVTKLKMYPYFDLAHAALCCLAVRDDLANGIFICSQKSGNLYTCIYTKPRKYEKCCRYNLFEPRMYLVRKQRLDHFSIL